MLVVVRWNSTFHFNNTQVKTDFFKTWNKIGSSQFVQSEALNHTKSKSNSLTSNSD